MLIDLYCQIEACPQPGELLAAGEAAGIRTLGVTTSLLSYVRGRIVCRGYDGVHLALGLAPRSIGRGYEAWPEWQELLATTLFVGGVGLDFDGGDGEERSAQLSALAEIAGACARGNRVLLLQAAGAEAEAWEIVAARHVRWVVWHGYRPDGPRALLYRAIGAGHQLAVGPEIVQSDALRQRLRAVPREQVLTASDCLQGAPEGRASALRQVIGALAEVWQCSVAEAELQVERNYGRILADVL